MAIDGTKIKANASKQQAMSYGRMNETEARLKQEIKALLQQAEQTDAAEDALYGKDKRGDGLPDELQRRKSRLKNIQQAKAELEEKAANKVEQKRAAAEAKLAARRQKEERTGKKPGVRAPQIPTPEEAQPDARAQRNFTDALNRIMPDGDNSGSFVQDYNAQAAIDSTAQVIVAAEIAQQANDSHQLLPMLKQVEANMGRQAEAVSADAGYCSEANATHETVVGIDLYIAAGRIRTVKTSQQKAAHRPSYPPPSKPCSTNCAPRQDDPFTADARSSSNQSSAKSRSNEASAASACAGWKRCGRNRSWSAP